MLDPESAVCKSLLLSLVDSITVYRETVLIEGPKFKAMGVISDYETGHSSFRVPSLMSIWRRERDSNPRYAINVYTLSRRAPSATQPSLQIVHNWELDYIIPVMSKLRAYSRETRSAYQVEP